MNSNYWKKFYKKTRKLKHSSFAEFVAPFVVKDSLIELGAGNGRDLGYFHDIGITARGVDMAYGNLFITKMDVGEYIKTHKCNDNVYTRFFWHSIDRKLQLAILKWTTGNIFIEARTTDDKFRPKTFAKHERNFVNVVQLVKIRCHDFETPIFGVGFVNRFQIGIKFNTAFIKKTHGF